MAPIRIRHLRPTRVGHGWFSDDRARTGSIDTLSVRGYQALPRGQRLRYRLCRHPLVLLGLGPVYLFLLQNRVPVGFMRAGRMPWLSTMGTDVAIVLLANAMISLVGAGTFFIVHLPTAILAGASFPLRTRLRDAAAKRLSTRLEYTA